MAVTASILFVEPRDGVFKVGVAYDAEGVVTRDSFRAANMEDAKRIIAARVNSFDAKAVIPVGLVDLAVAVADPVQPTKEDTDKEAFLELLNKFERQQARAALGVFAKDDPRLVTLDQLNAAGLQKYTEGLL